MHGVHDDEHKKKKTNNIKEKITQGTILRVERKSMIEEQFEETYHLD